MTGQQSEIDPPWGTTDPDEQLLWAFGQQDYRFCIERISAALDADGGVSFWQLQLMMISLQRSGHADVAADLGARALSGYGAYSWASACVRLTLGEGTVDAAIIAASDDAERWMSWYWEWSRALTTWRRQAAERAQRECEALDRTASAPIEVRERMLLPRSSTRP